jgi:trimethylamine--corrinoid protein Co-methyltransferase
MVPSRRETGQQKTIELLSQEALDSIHSTSMRILSEVGIEFPDSEAVEIFKNHGCKTDGFRVYLEETIVLDAISQAPSQFRIHARDPEKDVIIGDGKVTFAPGYGAPFVMDEVKGSRSATLEDFDTAAKLAHALPNQDLSGYLLVQPDDVPASASHLYMLRSLMLHSSKPFMGSPEGVPAANQTLQMSAILLGKSIQQIQEKPILLALVNTLSPLGFSVENVGALREYARNKQPIMVAAAAMAGSTAPITLAGLLAQQNAEILSGLTLAQLIQPGLPVIYGATSTNMDMKTGGMAIGSPELSLIVAAVSQLGKRYGLPARSGGCLTDANSVDARAGMESSFSMLTAGLSGIDFVLHAGGILSSFLMFSFEKFVLDDEVCGMVRRFLRGIQTDEDSLSFEVISNVGPGGNYLMEDQTFERCHTEFWQPTLFDRLGLPDWLKTDREEALELAKRRCQELLDTYQIPEIDDQIRMELDAYVDTQSEQLS